MNHSSSHIRTATVLALVALLFGAGPAEAIDKCKVKIDKKTGVIRVDAKPVEGTLRWGDESGSEANAMFNAETCVKKGKAVKCELADPSTDAAKTPPAGCTLYMNDDSTVGCEVWIRGCTPGIRTAAGSGADPVAQCAAGTDVVFEGCNVHVRNSSGTTGGTADGLGNLIVDWNEATGGQTRTGSHNLIVGSENEFTSYGALVAGETNTSSAEFASVVGGSHNTANGSHASVSGGSYNTASGYHASVSGGAYNTAYGARASVSGGRLNTANGEMSSVSGGNNLTTSAYAGWVAGN